MRSGMSLSAAGHATSLLIAITYVLCVAFDLVFPRMAMYEVWLKLLPGFEWLTWKSFFLGLAESYAYGWYIVFIWVPLYNVFSRRAQGHGAAAQWPDAGSRPGKA